MFLEAGVSDQILFIERPAFVDSASCLIFLKPSCKFVAAEHGRFRHEHFLCLSKWRSGINEYFTQIISIECLSHSCTVAGIHIECHTTADVNLYRLPLFFSLILCAKFNIVQSRRKSFFTCQFSICCYGKQISISSTLFRNPCIHYWNLSEVA